MRTIVRKVNWLRTGGPLAGTFKQRNEFSGSSKGVGKATPFKENVVHFR
jgi:hypothetical protein